MVTRERPHSPLIFIVLNGRPNYGRSGTGTSHNCYLTVNSPLSLFWLLPLRYLYIRSFIWQKRRITCDSRDHVRHRRCCFYGRVGYIQRQSRFKLAHLVRWSNTSTHHHNNKVHRVTNRLFVCSNRCTSTHSPFWLHRGKNNYNKSQSPSQHLQEQLVAAAATATSTNCRD